MSNITVPKQTQEIDTPEGIMNFLQKRNGQFTKNYKYYVKNTVITMMEC